MRRCKQTIGWWLYCRTNGPANQTWQLEAATRAPSRRGAAGYSGIWVWSVVEARRRAAETAAARPASRWMRDWRGRRSWAVPRRCSSPSRRSTRRRRRPAPSRSDGRRASTVWSRSASCRPRDPPAAPVEAAAPAHRSSSRNSRHRRRRYLLQISTWSWKRRSNSADDQTKSYCIVYTKRHCIQAVPD